MKNFLVITCHKKFRSKKHPLKILVSRDLEPENILKIFLNFINFEPHYSYKIYSDKKKSVRKFYTDFLQQKEVNNNNFFPKLLFATLITVLAELADQEFKTKKFLKLPFCSKLCRTIKV